MAQSFINRSDLPLGLRNNNPGNLRPSSGAWQGQIGTNQNFVVFEDISWGIRAFATNFYSSVKKHNTDTIRKYIKRYAPESENDTNTYIKYVSDSVGISADEPIPTDMETLKKILRAQMEVELGKRNADLVTDEDINEGLSKLDSPIASFFGSLGVIYKNNEKKVNYAIIGATLIGLSAYVYLLYKKRIIK
jgi:hypothetical protein